MLWQRTPRSDPDSTESPRTWYPTRVKNGVPPATAMPQCRAPGRPGGAQPDRGHEYERLRSRLAAGGDQAGQPGPGSGHDHIRPRVTGTITLSSTCRTCPPTSCWAAGASALAVARSTDPGVPAFRIFRVTQSATVTISGLTITGGSADSGSGIYNAGMLTIMNATLSSNSGNFESSGGGIFNAGMLTITASTISDNIAGTDGGGIANTGTLTISARPSAATRRITRC